MRSMGTNPGLPATRRSPLRELLEAQMRRVLGAVEGTRDGPVDRKALQQFLDALERLVESADSLTEPVAEDGPAPSREIAWVGDSSEVIGDLDRLLPPGYRLRRFSTLEGGAGPSVALLIASSAHAGSVTALRKINPTMPAIVLVESAVAAAVRHQLEDEPVVLLRSPIDAGDLAMCAAALLAISPPDEERPPPIPLEPMSYAHLAGLLPRALERAIAFDIGAAVVARPGEEPLIDVYARGGVSRHSVEKVRQRALALFRLLATGVASDDDVAALTAQTPYRSSLHVPLSTQGAIFGVTYLVARRADAFSPEDGRVLTELASHAAAAYRRLDGAVSGVRSTPRQSQILSLIAAGFSDQAIADRLGVAHRTVRTHLDRFLREHGLRSRTEAVAAWLRGQQD